MASISARQKFAVVAIGISVFSLLLYFIALELLTAMAVSQFITIDDARVREYTDSKLTSASLVHSIWWPGCNYVAKLSDFQTKCGEPCFSAKLMKDMHDFNENHPGQLVRYTSRRHENIENVTLIGWWLPAPSERHRAPRVVLQHGFTGNSNKFRPFFAAYLLRRLGFSVLLNNFRDHGYSDNSSAHIYEWGHSYPYDLLGAWDYAIRDPDGVLGSYMPPEKVGIMGFSLGAFTALNAFGLESEVPAVWVDGPPFTPKAVFAHGVQKQLTGMGIPFGGSLLIDPVWERLLDKAVSKGVYLNKHLPIDVLPMAPDTRRPVYLTSSENDNTVPISEIQLLADLFQAYPEKYGVEIWVAKGTCNGLDHCVDHLSDFEEYSQRLCRFWMSAFSISTSSC